MLDIFFFRVLTKSYYIISGLELLAPAGPWSSRTLLLPNCGSSLTSFTGITNGCSVITSLVLLSVSQFSGQLANSVSSIAKCVVAKCSNNSFSLLLFYSMIFIL